MSSPLNIITLFSGFGTQEIAIRKVLNNHNRTSNLVYYCEINDRISKCFSLLHDEPTSKNLGDITLIDTTSLDVDCEIDIVVSSFPCQSFSIAGKKQGFEDTTRGNLYDTAYQLISKVRPKVVIYENVKGILNRKYGAVEKITNSMESIGYSCFHKVLNARDYGIPQNRCRWFMVCIRKDICTKPFEFPLEKPLTLSVKDFVVDGEKRSCSKDMEPYFDSKFHKYSRSKIGLVKVFDGVQEGHFNSGFTTHRIYSIDGIAPTFTTSNDCHFLELKGKLHTRERFLLMGCSNEDYDTLIDNGISTRLIDFMTGNAIVVNVFESLFESVLPYLS